MEGDNDADVAGNDDDGDDADGVCVIGPIGVVWGIVRIKLADPSRACFRSTSRFPRYGSVYAALYTSASDATSPTLWYLWD